MQPQKAKEKALVLCRENLQKTVAKAFLFW